MSSYNNDIDNTFIEAVYHYMVWYRMALDNGMLTTVVIISILFFFALRWYLWQEYYDKHPEERKKDKT